MSGSSNTDVIVAVWKTERGKFELARETKNVSDLEITFDFLFRDIFVTRVKFFVFQFETFKAFSLSLSCSTLLNDTVKAHRPIGFRSLSFSEKNIIAQVRFELSELMTGFSNFYNEL